MLYLIKGSRVREYHRQNIEMLSAPEHHPFEIAYSRRWVQSGLAPAAKDGALIVFADSPYESFVPVRFAVVDTVLDDEERVVVSGRLGAFVHTDDREALTRRWAERADDERPGRHRFLVSDDNVGFRTPDSPQAERQAWRETIDQLAANPFFAESTIVRVDGIEAGGHPWEAGQAVPVGGQVTFHLDARSPVPPATPIGLSVASEPDGVVEINEVFDPAANSTGALTVTLSEPGDVSLSVAVSGRPLTSTRSSWAFHAHGASPVSSGPSADGQASINVDALVRRLRRSAHLSSADWVDLLDEFLLPSAPDSPTLLNELSLHAEEIGRHDRVVDALHRIADRTDDQQLRLLTSSVRIGLTDGLSELMAATDFSQPGAFTALIDAVRDDAPETTAHQLLQAELRERTFGDDRMTELVRVVWPKIQSVPLLCQAAESVAYVDPAAGARLLLDRWPDPASMPQQAVDLVLDWQVDRSRLGPYVRERVRRASERGDLAALDAAIAQVSAVSTTDQGALLLAAGQRLAAEPDDAVASRGLDLCVDALHRMIRAGRIDEVVHALPQVSGAAQQLGGDAVTHVSEIERAVARAVEQSDELQRWERMRSESRADALRPRVRGRRLFFVGGVEPDWAAALMTDLGVADYRWIATDKDKSANHDWATSVTELDVVIAVLPFVGHDNTSVKSKVLTKGAQFQIAWGNTLAVIAALEQACPADLTDR